MNNDKRTNVRIVQRIGFFLIGLFLLVGCKKERPNKDLEYIQGQIFTEYKSFYVINQLDFLSSNWYDQFKTAYNKANRETVTFEHETAIVCDITTNETNEKAKFQFQPIEYNTILEGEGIAPEEK